MFFKSLWLMGARMKVTVKNVVDLWFAEDTPIRDYKIRMNPQLWAMCQQVSEQVSVPSGKLSQQQYPKSAKVAFARLVLAGLAKAQARAQQKLFKLV
jgi:hypothetical protein